MPSIDDAQRSMAHFSPRTDPPKRSAPSPATPPHGKRIRTLEQGAGEGERSPTPGSSQVKLRWLSEIGVRKTLHHAVYGDPQPSEKVASFALDHTIIRPHGDQRYSETANDWHWWSEPTATEGEKEEDKTVVNKLKELHADGYAIVIFASQRHDSADWWQAFKKRVANVTAQLGVPLHLFVSRDFDIYRKPCPGVWMEFEKEWNGGKKIDLSKSFYVGDAAGKGNSFQDYDQFAWNIGIEFFTPSEFFLGRQKSKGWSFKGWSSREYDQDVPLFTPTNTPLVPRPPNDFEPAAPDIVVLIGPPGCGKTYFASKYLVKAGYIRITDNPALSAKKALLTSPTASLVIDTSLPSLTSRKSLLVALRFLPTTKNHTIRCFLFIAPEKLAKHNNVFAVLFDQQGEGEEARKEGRGRGKRSFTTESEYRKWYGEYVEPSKEEGFDELKRINFKFDLDRPDGKERLKNWHKFLNCYPFEPEKK